MTTYVYPDAYLATFCTTEREARAIEDVAVLVDSRTLSSDWAERLTILQTYILACLENQGDPEDLFTAKLKSYREELAIQLPRAIAAADETADVVSAPYTYPVVRA